MQVASPLGGLGYYIALFATQQLPEGKALSISHPFYPSNFDRFLDLLFLKLSGIEFHVVRVIVSSNCSYPIFFRGHYD